MENHINNLSTDFFSAKTGRFFTTLILHASVHNVGVDFKNLLLDWDIFGTCYWDSEETHEVVACAVRRAWALFGTSRLESRTRNHLHCDDNYSKHIRLAACSIQSPTPPLCRHRTLTFSMLTVRLCLGLLPVLRLKRCCFFIPWSGHSSGFYFIVYVILAPNADIYVYLLRMYAWRTHIYIVLPSNSRCNDEWCCSCQFTIFKLNGISPK